MKNIIIKTACYVSLLVFLTITLTFPAFAAGGGGGGGGSGSSVPYLSPILQIILIILFGAFIAKKSE